VDTQPVLVVEHEAQCPAGWMGEWLVEAGVQLDVRRPYAGDGLPGDLAGHAGMLVLGGSMGAYDDAAHPWLAEVKRLLLLAVHDGTPTLGICLGHQLIAVALGGEVTRVPGGQQVGLIDVGWTGAAAADPLLGPLAAPARGVQWNSDIVRRLPVDAVLLAETAAHDVQAARFAPNVWGVQWHPEVGEEILRPWAEDDREDAVERGVDVDGYLDQVAAARDELRSTWRPLAEQLAAVCGGRVVAS
jgi:GMP synthase (glutamine-hydrolysing)